MNAVIFAIGVVVTLLVGGGLSLLFYAAILDGRDEAARKAADAERSTARLVQAPSDQSRGRSAA
jgi:hypothetical protein